MMASFLLPIVCMGVVSFGILYKGRYLLFFGWLLTGMLGVALILWNVLGVPLASDGPITAMVAFALFQAACAVCGWLWARMRGGADT